MKEPEKIDKSTQELVQKFGLTAGTEIELRKIATADNSEVVVGSILSGLLDSTISLGKQISLDDGKL